ncbi:MAG: hypothetical protein COA79_03625 [Planctomycetota bacterium]|nr:MAG: hypothetical protein COA79_03625 [Planctomycetota bacterium]
MADESFNQNIEIELKVKIPDKESYLRILEQFGEDFHLIHQRNIYYDTNEGDLQASKIMFRLRNANEEWVATVKSNASQVNGVQKADENEIILDQQPTSINELKATFCKLKDGGFLNGHDLMPLGEIINERHVFNKLDNEIFEIDHTIIAGHHFYEIEIETENINKIRNYVQELFAKLTLPFEYADSKYKRFLLLTR